MRQRFERVGHDPQLVVPRAAVIALGEMRTQRPDAESGVAIDQEVDLVGKEVAVVHVFLQRGVRGWGPSGFKDGSFEMGDVRWESGVSGVRTVFGVTFCDPHRLETALLLPQSTI